MLAAASTPSTPRGGLICYQFRRRGRAGLQGLVRGACRNTSSYQASHLYPGTCLRSLHVASGSVMLLARAPATAPWTTPHSGLASSPVIIGNLARNGLPVWKLIGAGRIAAGP